MEWSDIKYYLAVMREGSVTQAGKSLGVNHTTVSRRIIAFEKKLNVRLFDRLPTGYKATEAADKIFNHALQMEESALSIDREILGGDNELRGSLRLTIETYVASRLLFPYLAEFRRRYPFIEIQIKSSSDLSNLNFREADIAIRLTPSPPENLVGKRICMMGHGIYASKNYLDNFIEIKHSVVDLVLWGSEKEKPVWSKAPFADSKVAVRVDTAGNMLAAIKGGLGLARLPCYLAEGEETIRQLPIALTPSSWGLWVLSHPDLRDTARVRVCREFLYDIFERQRDIIEGIHDFNDKKILE
jgi:DNA-binding transcriptional LysR family regulator